MFPRFLKHSLVWVWLVFCRTVLMAQSNEPFPLVDADYHESRWTTEQGLPQSTVYKIITASDGYVWLITNDGFARFDGVKFSVYNSGNVKGMKGNSALDIEERRGKLWVLTVSELICIEGDKLDVFPLPGQYYHWLSLQFVANSEIRLSLDNKIYRFQDGRFSLARTFPRDVHPFVLDDNHILGYTNPGTIHFKQTRLIGYKHGAQADLLQRGEMKLVGEIEKGRWLISQLEYSDVDGRPAPMKWYTTDTSLQLKPFVFPIRVDSILDIGVMPNYGQYYIGRNRLYVVDEKQAVKAFFLQPHSAISAMTIDREGIIWLGTYTDGLDQVIPKRVKIYRKSEVDLGHTEVWFVRQIDGNLYAGANQQFYRFDQKEKKYIRLPSCPGGWDVEKDKEGTWYYATHGTGLAIQKQDKITWLTTLPSKVVHNLSYDGKRLWIGTEGGLAILESGTLKDLSSVDSFPIQHISHDLRGNTWVASFNGVVQYNASLKPILRLGLNDGLPTLAVRSLYVDRDNILWIGTLHAGLCCYKNGLVYRFPHGLGSINENVLSIIEDDYGYIWMSSNAGLYKVKRSELLAHTRDSLVELSVHRISQGQGLEVPEFNSHTQGNVVKTGDHLWYPGLKGIVSVNTMPHDAKSLRMVKIDEVYVNSGKVPMNGDYVQVPGNLSVLRIMYSFPEFTMPENVYFEYQLNNSGIWEANGRERQLVFNDIRPGMNEIKIRVQGEQRFARVFVYAEYRWYERPWAIVCLVLLGIFLLIFCTALVIRNINNRKLAREYLKRRMAVLELAALHNQINPHFIFNCVNSIQSIFFSKKFIVGNEYITQFSLFLRTCLEHSKKNIVTLNEEMEIIRYYLNLEKLQFNDDEFQFDIRIDPSINLDAVTLPSFLLQPFAENSIKHGLLKSTNPDKRITISVGKNPKGNVYVHIDDNGPGMEATRTVKTRPSRGLEMTNERVRNFNQIYGRNIRASYEDLAGKDNTYLTGTRIIIELD